MLGIRFTVYSGYHAFAFLDPLSVSVYIMPLIFFFVVVKCILSVQIGYVTFNLSFWI